jgi:hypothetical protein
VFGEELNGMGVEVSDAANSRTDGAGQAGVVWFGQLRERLTGEDTVVVWLAPRGVGFTGWSQDERQAVQLRRRFMLLGQTLDGMRVWDIRQGLAVLRSLDRFHKSEVHLRGAGVMGVNALMAALFEPDLGGLEVEGLPSTFRAGPDYLNIMRIIEVPQAVAMAAEHCRVRVIGAAAGDWSYAGAVAEGLGWERGRVRIEME